MHTADFQSESGKKNCFRIARHMAREGRHVISAVRNMMSGMLYLVLIVYRIFAGSIWRSSYMLRMTGMVNWIVLR